jgi:hypothetical protein
MGDHHSHGVKINGHAVRRPDTIRRLLP